MSNAGWCCVIQAQSDVDLVHMHIECLYACKGDYGIASEAASIAQAGLSTNMRSFFLACACNDRGLRKIELAWLVIV